MELPYRNHISSQIIEKIYSVDPALLPEWEKKGSEIYILKPKGFWYSIGESGIRWALEEKSEKDLANSFKNPDNFVYDVQIDENYFVSPFDGIFYTRSMKMENKILRITSTEDCYRLFDLEIIKKAPYSPFGIALNWDLIKKSFRGIEIINFNQIDKENFKFIKAYDFDSGCIWDPRVLNSVSLSGQVGDILVNDI